MRILLKEWACQNRLESAGHRMSVSSSHFLHLPVSDQYLLRPRSCETAFNRDCMSIIYARQK
jgi:hypothetical protein